MSESESGEEDCITECTDKAVTFEPTIKALQSAHQVTSETYFFDKVFSTTSTQKDVYEGAVVSSHRASAAGLPFSIAPS